MYVVIAVLLVILKAGVAGLLLKWNVLCWYCCWCSILLWFCMWWKQLLGWAQTRRCNATLLICCWGRWQTHSNHVVTHSPCHPQCWVSSLQAAMLQRTLSCHPTLLLSFIHFFPLTRQQKCCSVFHPFSVTPERSKWGLEEDEGRSGMKG